MADTSMAVAALLCFVVLSTVYICSVDGTHTHVWPARIEDTDDPHYIRPCDSKNKEPADRRIGRLEWVDIEPCEWGTYGCRAVKGTLMNVTIAFSVREDAGRPERRLDPNDRPGQPYGGGIYSGGGGAHRQEESREEVSDADRAFNDANLLLEVRSKIGYFEDHYPKWDPHLCRHESAGSSASICPLRRGRVHLMRFDQIKVPHNFPAAHGEVRMKVRDHSRGKMTLSCGKFQMEFLRSNTHQKDEDDIDR